MPNNRTPEQRRQYRERCIAEGRCGNCGIQRAPGDTETTTCRKCRERKNRGSANAYAARRAENPPFKSGLCQNPAQSFRYGKTRLADARRIGVTLDDLAQRAVAALCAHYYASDAGKDLEAYQMGHILREAIKARRDFGNAYPRRPIPRRPRGTGRGYFLCFMADAETWAVIERQRLTFAAAFPYTRAAAVRDLIVGIAYPLLDKTSGR